MSVGVNLMIGYVLFEDRSKIGKPLTQHKGVSVYHNGQLYAESYGRHYSPDGYYYGQKWQCVEFVKRFFFLAKQHRMPNVWGHAKDFFDSSINHGELNKQRGLVQFFNGKEQAPQLDDLLVFQDTLYGHVAVVSEVGKSWVEVVQQNIYGKPRQRFSLAHEKNLYSILAPRRPAGWLRIAQH